MPHPHTTRGHHQVLIALLLVLTGCPASDERLVQLSRESLHRQAEQNEAMARQGQEVATASRELVAADAAARREIIEVHHELQGERAHLNLQHEKLSEERQTIAKERHRDPIIANALLALGLIAASLLPLAVAYRLLSRLNDQSDDGVLVDVLVSEMASSDPLFLPAPPDAGSVPRIPSAEPPANSSEQAAP